MTGLGACGGSGRVQYSSIVESDNMRIRTQKASWEK